MFKEYELKIILFIFIFLPFNLQAEESCELTKDYQNARIKAYRVVRGSESPYSKCKDTMNEAHYWKAVAKCEIEGKGKNVGGGCQHVAGYQSLRIKVDVSHCEVLKPKEWKKEVKAYLEYFVESKHIVKCKHNQSLQSTAQKERLN